MSLPRLHVVAADDVLAADGFIPLAMALLEAGARDLALHLRGHGTPAALLYDRAAALSRVAARSGSTLFVNDRVDVALALDRVGVVLGKRSLPVSVVRRLAGNRCIGYSAHEAAEAKAAVDEGADFVLLGTIYATASHPARPGAGPDLVRATAATTNAPVIAIGGITPERVAEVVAARAHGVAVLGGVFRSGDPRSAVLNYLDVLGGRTS